MVGSDGGAARAQFLPIIQLTPQGLDVVTEVRNGRPQIRWFSVAR